VLYHYASGHQHLAQGAPVIDDSSTFALGSAGKFITHIAALQCVDRGLIKLDEPVYSYLPELEKLEVISRNQGPDASTRPFILQPPSKNITLRYLLSHSSGIAHESHPLIKEWRASTGQAPKQDFHPTANWESDTFRLSNTEPFSTPLLFEPREGWMYGASIEWTSLLISRLTKQRLQQYIQENIFNPLGMTSSTYQPQTHPELAARALQMVRRDGDRLLPVNYPLKELIVSVPDLGILLADLISPSSLLLEAETQDLLFMPQFESESRAREYIRRDAENYAAPAGIPETMHEAPVNHSLAALVVEEELPLSHMPLGSVTWNGMPNVVWAMHKEREIGVVFATQLLPVDDGKTVEIMMEFMRGVWETFGKV
jgi:CubicO group peptidase (beta-lactamase class C family)